MGNSVPFVDDDTDDGDNLVNKLRKANKAKEKQLEELQARLEALESQQRGGDVAGQLRDAGIDPRFVKFYPKDAPTTADAVANWVAENRDLIGLASPSREPQTSTLSEDAQRGLDTYRQLAEADAAVEMDLSSRLKAANTPEELMAVLKGFTPPVGMR